LLHHIVIASSLDTGEEKDNPVSRDCLWLILAGDRRPSILFELNINVSSSIGSRASLHWPHAPTGPPLFLFNNPILYPCGYSYIQKSLCLIHKCTVSLFSSFVLRDLENDFVSVDENHSTCPRQWLEARVQALETPAY
jgi:hypothetical protein